jgi:hypothetical protein
MAARFFCTILVLLPTVALAPIASCGGSADSGNAPDASADAPSSGHDASEDIRPDARGDGGTIEGGMKDAPICLTDLSDVGTGDFSIHFELTTNETGLTLALLNQRLGCDKTSTFWDVSLSPTGTVFAATGDGIAADYVSVQAGNVLNDGKSHQVDVIRGGGQIWIAADGAVVSPMTPDPSTFTTLSSLAIGTSACTGVTPAAGHAVIAGVCLTEP